MESEWREVRLGDLAEIYDGPHATPHTVAEGPMFLGIVCLNSGRLDLSKAEHLTETDFTRWTRRVTPRPGDVVFSYETRIGEAARIPPDFRGCLGRRMGLLRPKPNVDPSFLLYAYLAPEFQETLRSRTIHGSTVDRIPLVQLGDFPIRVPPLAEQQVIGSVLAALDDKIELTRRMSQTLESMARALFKSWFVDFDPVRAQSQGRRADPSMRLASVFPATLEDSRLGKIPSGWRVSTVGDEFRVVMGQSPPGSTYNSDGTGAPFYQGRSDFGERFPSRRVYCTAPTRHASAGDTLVCVRAPVGDTNQASEDCAIGRGLAAVRHRNGAVSYTYLAMRNLRDRFAAYEAGGTVFGAIGKDQFRDLPVLAPTAEAVVAFEEVVGSLDGRLASAQAQLSSLIAVRDGLLPVLLSSQHMTSSLGAEGG